MKAISPLSSALALALVLFGSACSAPTPAPQVRPIALTPVPEKPLPVSPATTSAASSPDSDPAAEGCVEMVPILYGRFVAMHAYPAHEAAERAFDRAAGAYRVTLYLEAARGFMEAAAHYLAVKALKDRRSSYRNAVLAWRQTRRPAEGRRALLDAAAADPELADELRAMALDLQPRAPMCPTSEP